MARKREKPTENPLLRERVGAIVGETKTAIVQSPTDQSAAVQNPSKKLNRNPHRRRGMKTVHLKVRMSAEEAEAVEKFARTLSSYMRTKVMGSEVTRALWTIALRAEERLAEVSHKAPSLERPSYGDKLAMAEFEDIIADFLQRTLK